MTTPTPFRSVYSDQHRRLGDGGMSQNIQMVIHHAVIVEQIPAPEVVTL